MSEKDMKQFKHEEGKQYNMEMKRLWFSHLLQDLGGITLPRSLKETSQKKYVPKWNGSVNVYILTPKVPPAKPPKIKYENIPDDPENFVTDFTGKRIKIKRSYSAKSLRTKQVVELPKYSNVEE